MFKNKKRVLIIKEDQVFNNILKKHFQHRDYDVEITSNGVDGMHKAIQNRPNVIILDIDLPTVSGFMVTRKMKNNEILKDIPIVMVSSKGQDINIRKSQQLGIKEYISVPTQIDVLTDKVESYMVEEENMDWFEFNLAGGTMLRG